MKKIGISDFRWHDLRRRWASSHVQRGTPLHMLKALGGWGAMEMVQRYAHMSADHPAQWVQSISNDGVLIREVNMGANNLPVGLINDMRLDVYARQVNFMRAQKQTG